MKKFFGFLPAGASKYIVTLLVFALWMAFFDRHDWFSQHERDNELQAVKDHVEYLRAEIAEMNAQRMGIINDPKVLEKFARENYHLKKDNEDVFVFE